MSDTLEIQLTQGKVAVVNASDYAWLTQWKWYAHKRSGKWYAERHARKTEGPRGLLIHMHRLILEAKGSIEVDHIDGDGLNNQRSNLRLATHSQNGKNHKINARNTSGCPGVGWKKSEQKWGATIVVDHKPIHLGLYSVKEKAIEAYRNAADKYYGEFARKHG